MELLTKILRAIFTNANKKETWSTTIMHHVGVQPHQVGSKQLKITSSQRGRDSIQVRLQNILKRQKLQSSDI